MDAASNESCRFACPICGASVAYTPAVMEVVHCPGCGNGLVHPLHLAATPIPSEIIEILPPLVAVENMILPVTLDGETLIVAMAHPADEETLEKLRFILYRRVEAAFATEEAIRSAIDHHYGDAVDDAATSNEVVLVSSGTWVTQWDAEWVRKMLQRYDRGEISVYDAVLEFIDHLTTGLKDPTLVKALPEDIQKAVRDYVDDWDGYEGEQAIISTIESLRSWFGDRQD